MLTNVFTYLVPNLRLGPVSHQTKSENLQAYYVNATSATSTGEFTIQHGMGRTPYVYVQVGALDRVNSRTIPLTVTRAADASRIYLKTEAGSTNAPFSLLLE